MPFDRAGRRRGALASSDPGFPALKARVIARTGHHYYIDKDDLLYDRLVRRFRELRLADCTAYAAFLEGPGANEEWAALVDAITIGETFFFRYAEQFTALRDEIVPQLIAARRSERRLRIWSAGCASGAEPYSLAILVHGLLGDALPDWTVEIVGTDISAAALATARNAEFGRWALRTTPPEDRVRWFQRVEARPGPTREGGYKLRREFRAMVRFERQNLLGLLDGSTPAAFAEFDLILCRNVLIYFSADHVRGIVRGFAERLRPGGWLLLGHAEPNPEFGAWLDPISLLGTAAYRRGGALPEPVKPPPAAPVLAVAPLELPPVAIIEPVRVPEPPPLPPPADIRPITDATDVIERVRAMANTGDTGAGWRLVRDALLDRPNDPSLRFYEGLLARGLGREAEAERALRGALFLNRDFLMAHFHLGLLLSDLGRAEPARRALENALHLTHALAPTAPVPEGDGLSAGELATSARLALESLGGPRG